MGSNSYSKVTEDFGLAKVTGLVHFNFLFSYMLTCLCDLGIILLTHQKLSVSTGRVYCCDESRLTLHCLVLEYIAKRLKMFK